MRPYIFLMLLCFSAGFVTSCSAYEDLQDIEKTKNNCRQFKAEYDKVMPAKTTKLIDGKITECKDAGAWDEKK